MKTYLCILYNKQLWFQIGELIQELIILVKNCFFIDDHNQNKLWDLFGRDLFQLFEKFSDAEKEILPKIPSTILSLGILRFQISYNENKLSFLEEEIYRNMHGIRKNLCTIVLIKELISLNLKLNSKKFPFKIFLKRIFYGKNLSSGRIDKFIKMLTEKDFSSDHKNFSNLIGEKMVLKKLFSSVIYLNSFPNPIFSFKKNKCSYYCKKYNRTLSKPKINIVVQNLLLEHIDLEKKEWIFKFSYKNEKCHEINQTIFKYSFKNNSTLVESKSTAFKYYLRTLNDCIKFKKKKNLRWARVSKKLYGDKKFIEEIFRILIPNLSIKVFLSEERQLISILRNSFPNDLMNYYGSKKKLLYVQQVLNRISTLTKNYMVKP